MNHRKYLNNAALKTNPLCGISTYKDTLNLATGQITREIKKLVLTGEETLNELSAGLYRITENGYMRSDDTLIGICSHFGGGYTVAASPSAQQNTISFLVSSSGNNYIYLSPSQYLTISDFKSYLQQQYAASTPVTIWYVLATPDTEQIALPSGLSGTLEGSLTQSGTPTPSAPFYPTAVTGEGWYNINTYKRSVLVWNTDTAYERDSGAWT